MVEVINSFPRVVILSLASFLKVARYQTSLLDVQTSFLNVKD